MTQENNEVNLDKELNDILSKIMSDQEAEMLKERIRLENEEADRVKKIKEDTATKVEKEIKEEIGMVKDVKDLNKTTTNNDEVEETKEVVEMNNVKSVQNFRYFVVGKNGAVISAAQVVGTNKVSMKEATSGDTGHTFTLCLEEINRILRIIKDLKGDADFLKEPIQIRTLTGLANSIDSKNFLFWVRKGTYSDGKAIDERTLKAWSDFIQLYGELYADVVILGHKVSGKNETQDGKIQRALLNKMFNELPKELALDIEFTK